MKKGTKILLWVVGLISTGAIAVGGAISMSAYKQRDCEHEYNEGIVQIEATCESDGVTTYECEKCGKEKEETIAMLEHSIVRYEKTDATCTEDGHSSYTACERCGGEETGKTILPATGHTVKQLDAVPATCESEGLTRGEICESCEKVLLEQEVIPAGHTPVTVAGSAPTCTTKGLTAGKICSTCEEIIVEQKVIPATGHTSTGIFGEGCTVCSAAVYITNGYTLSEVKDGETAVGNWYRVYTTYYEPAAEDYQPRSFYVTIGSFYLTVTGGKFYLDDPGYASVLNIFTAFVGWDEEGKYIDIWVEEGVTYKYTVGFNEFTASIGEGAAISTTLTDSVYRITATPCASDHISAIIKGKEATCTESGFTDGSICLGCGEILVARQTIVELGHTGEFGGPCTDCGELIPLTNYTLSEVTEGESVVGNWYRIYADPDGCFKEIKFANADGSNAFIVWGSGDMLYADDPETMHGENSSVLQYMKDVDEKGDYFDLYIAEGLSFTVIDEYGEEGAIYRDVEVTDALTVTATSSYVYRINHEHELKWTIEEDRDVLCCVCGYEDIVVLTSNETIFTINASETSEDATFSLIDMLDDEIMQMLTEQDPDYGGIYYPDGTSTNLLAEEMNKIPYSVFSSHYGLNKYILRVVTSDGVSHDIYFNVNVVLIDNTETTA